MKYYTEPKPPEWWTTENTEAWMREVWKGDREASAAQVEWSAPYKGVDHVARPRTSPSTWTIAPETMAQWRVNDPRPSATHYYDGRPIERYQPLRVKKVRARKAVAA